MNMAISTSTLKMLTSFLEPPLYKNHAIMATKGSAISIKYQNPYLPSTRWISSWPSRPPFQAMVTISRIEKTK